MVLNKGVTAVLFAGLLTTVSHVAMAAESVNFVSWGGSTQDAQKQAWACLLYTSPSPRDQRGSRMPSSA